MDPETSQPINLLRELRVKLLDQCFVLCNLLLLIGIIIIIVVYLHLGAEACCCILSISRREKYEPNFLQIPHVEARISLSFYIGEPKLADIKKEIDKLWGHVAKEFGF